MSLRVTFSGAARSPLQLALFAVVLFSGCRTAPVRPPIVPVEPEAAPVAPVISPWPGTLATALRAAENGRFDDAERMLVEFSVSHAGSALGAESDFWRAMLKLDPANRAVSAREQLAMLDAYLSGGADQPRYAEALILRRVAEAMDSTRTLLSTVRGSAEARDKSRDEEIRRLNDVVDRTTAELERIKRRLSPKPTP